MWRGRPARVRIPKDVGEAPTPLFYTAYFATSFATSSVVALPPMS